MTCAVVAQQTATEAPEAFDTALVIDQPGSKSVSNGIPEPPGDTFAMDQARFEQTRDASAGLGRYSMAPPALNVTRMALWARPGR